MSAYRRIAETVLMAVSSLLPSACVQAESPRVAFDMSRVVACRDVTTPEFLAANPQDRLMQAKLEISSLILRGGENDLVQYLCRITSPNRNLLVVDYQPRTVPASDFAGNVGVEKKREKSRSLGVSVHSAWDLPVNATGSAEAGGKDLSSVRYELVPPQEAVAASGTLYRGYGVYFKLRRMRQSLLEGAREFSVVFRASASWRADYLQVHCEATGVDRGVVRQLDEQVNCGQADFLVALHLEGDDASRHAAQRFADAAAQLRRKAAENREKIHRQSYPTVFHEMGVLLGAVEPRISEGWLDELMYLPDAGRWHEVAGRLPDSVRLAARDYLAAREELGRLRH